MGVWDANFLVATRRMAAVLAAIVSTAFSHRYAMRGSAQLPALSRARLQFDCTDEDSCELAYESFTQSLADGEFPTCLHTCGWRACTPVDGAPAHLWMARLRTCGRRACTPADGAPDSGATRLQLSRFDRWTSSLSEASERSRAA